MTERHGASHRITQTRPGSASADTPRSTYRMASATWKSTAAEESGEHAVSTHPSNAGHVARVEHLDPVAGGWDRQVHEAGPFADPGRATLASAALSRRITQRGGSEPHRVSTTFNSYEDMAPEGATMRRGYR